MTFLWGDQVVNPPFEEILDLEFTLLPNSIEGEDFFAHPPSTILKFLRYS